MTNHAIFIIPYFGKLPVFFPFWLKSCGSNSFFHWLLITDNEIPGALPPNVILKKMTFRDFVKHIQSFFDFKISLEKPYKICDFRPAFGVIFQQDIAGYDYWGYCDIDLIWGDLSQLAEIVRQKRFDKILENGHCTLVKNTPEIRNGFQALLPGCLYYKDVFASPKSWIFDENGTCRNGFSEICKRLDFLIYSAPERFADIVIRYFHLTKLLRDDQKGTRHHEIYLKDEQGITEFYLDSCKNSHREAQWYVHFQKRKISVETANTEHFLLVPPGKIVDVPENFEKQLPLLAPEDFGTKLSDFGKDITRFPRLLRMRIIHFVKVIVCFVIENIFRIHAKK